MKVLKSGWSGMGGHGLQSQSGDIFILDRIIREVDYLSSCCGVD